MHPDSVDIPSAAITRCNNVFARLEVSSKERNTLHPWGTEIPANCNVVAEISMELTRSERSVPAATPLGHRTINGMWMPPSVKTLLVAKMFQSVIREEEHGCGIREAAGIPVDPE